MTKAYQDENSWSHIKHICKSRSTNHS